jgi:hypothetical protein
MKVDKALQPGEPRGIRFRPRDEQWISRFQKKYGFSNFTEALLQMVRKAAELEGWTR